MGRSFRLAPVAALAAVLWPAIPGGAAASQSARVELGRRIFFDPALSEPKGTSCASCHDPARAYSGDHGSGVGVAAGSRPGVVARRSTPSLFYLKFVPTFRFYSEDEDKHTVDVEPYGGFFWDGRSNSIAELVAQPMLNPREMNNRDLAQIAEKIGHAAYAPAFKSEFPDALDDPKAAMAGVGAALEAFLLSPPMAPFSSKFDDYVRGTAKLTPLEAKGLELFKDRHKGNCADCHKVVDTAPSPERSLFTDFGYEAVGAPPNRRVRQRDEDRGLCERTDALNPSSEPQWCVSFRTPSLRNVALRPSFMHNGAFTSLRDVVRFYATRSTSPARWYPSGVPFDDTPAQYRGLVNVSKAPYDRHPGDAPALDDAEVDAIVAFLGTLTDRMR
ncbi:MAG TPA: cytochrome c peroxidase [Polyangiaceae bacterium]|nr:cytochrome c peroxidase [Polyangiaceae bacterium]